MFTYPYISGQLARERQREMLAEAASRQRLGRQRLVLARASWCVPGTQRGARRSPRRAPWLRALARS